MLQTEGCRESVKQYRHKSTEAEITKCICKVEEEIV